jgi:CheY-like chemotaxis protein
MEQEASDAGRVIARAQEAPAEEVNAGTAGTKSGRSGEAAAGEDRVRILVIEGQCPVRGLLRELAARPGLGTWFHADNAVRALQIIENSGIDLVIVDISPACRACMRLIEKIRLQCPRLPLLTISAREAPGDSMGLSSAESAGDALSLEGMERITAAINYARSLLASKVCGFTVVVRI